MPVSQQQSTLLPFGHQVYHSSLHPGSSRPLPPTSPTNAVPPPPVPDTPTLRADVFALLDAFAGAEERRYASFVREWEGRGWGRVWFLLGEGRRGRVDGLKGVVHVFVEHFVPLYQLLQARDGGSEKDMGKGKGKKPTQERSIFLRALGALFALYTMYAAPYDDDKDTDELEGDRPRGCLALLPTPTWAEINLVPVLQARQREAGMEKVVVEKKKRARRKGRAPEPPAPPTTAEGQDEVGEGEEEGGGRPNKRARVDTTISTTRARSTGRTRAPAKIGTTSSTPAEADPPDDTLPPCSPQDSSSDEETAPTTRRRSRLRSKWKRPKPLTDPVEIAAAALATQRLLEGCSGTVKVHPDEGRVLISRELFEGCVVKMAGLVREFLGEEAESGEDGVGLVDEVIFVLREMLCLDQGKEIHLRQTGIFRLLVGHTPSPTTHPDDTSTAVRTFFGPLWYSSTTFASKMTKDVPEYIGGYLSLQIIHPTHTFHLALSRADALRLTVSERTDSGSSASDSEFVGICEMMLRERARREAFGLAPCFDEGGGVREEGGLMMLARSEDEDEDGEEGWEVVGVPELWVDRALLVQAERRAVEMIGSSSSSSSSGATEIGKGEKGTAFSKDAMDFVKMFSFGTSLANDGAGEGKFVRVPKSCLSEARLYVDSVLGARAKGAVSVSDAMMEMEGVRLESEEEDEEEGEGGEEIEVLDEPEVEVPREVDEVSPEPEPEPEPEPSPEPVQEAVQASTSTSTSIPGSSMMLALPGLGQPSRLPIPAEPVKKAKPKKKAVVSIPKKIEREKSAAVSLGELEDELEGVLVEARRRTVKALRV
ncbi:hypothetical protein A4X09_0g3541 [Tilletia walkeri]|uniref:Uncharacterized protein n=1 Tax=Tilletia walkeri TaxID=117179 RepID=A0A8X7NA65_9BASI|nr:hypothetical protein A4X09_0g3541 [Tilletia walkeri]